MTSFSATAPKIDFAHDYHDLGLTCWQKLVREGTPKDEARIIASAIAKFKLFRTPPTHRQKQLISEYSRFICRAQLWCSDLLL